MTIKKLKSLIVEGVYAKNDIIPTLIFKLIEYTMHKTLKFTPELTELIKQGLKTTTWRVFDGKIFLWEIRLQISVVQRL